MHAHNATVRVTARSEPMSESMRSDGVGGVAGRNYPHNARGVACAARPAGQGAHVGPRGGLPDRAGRV